MQAKLPNCIRCYKISHVRQFSSIDHEQYQVLCAVVARVKHGLDFNNLANSNIWSLKC